MKVKCIEINQWNQYWKKEKKKDKNNVKTRNRRKIKKNYS